MPEFQRIAGANGDLPSTSSLVGVVEEITRLAVSSMGGTMGAVFMLDRDAGFLRPMATLGLPERFVDGCDFVPVGAGPCGQVLQQLQPVIIDDTHTTVFRKEGALAAASGIRALVFVPITTADGRVLGVLATYFASPFVPTEQAISRSQSYARLIAMVVACQVASHQERQGIVPCRGAGEDCPEIITRIDRQLRHVFVNPAVRKATGWSESDLIGKTHGELGFPDTVVETVQRALGDVFATGREAIIEQGLPLPVGERVFQMRMRPEFGPGDDVVAVLVVSRDITSAGQVLAALHDAKTEQQLVGEVAYALAASLDYEKTLTQTARLAVDAFADWASVDLAQEDGTIKRVAVIHGDPAKAELAAKVQACDIPPDEVSDIPHVIRTGESRLITGADEVVLRQRGNADERVALALALGIRSYVIVPLKSRGRILGALSFIRGDGQRPYDDDALSVCRQIADRAAVAIDNARLYAEARSAVQQRQNLLAIVSHDLRNMLSMITMNVAAALQHWPPASPKRLEKVMQTAERMDSLISELLDPGSIEAGQFRIRPVSLDAVAIVRDAVDGCSPLAAERRQSLTFAGPAGPVPLLADRDRLHQVLANVIGNAIKFTPDGGQIAVTAVQAGDTARISVQDSGPGIPRDQVPHLFERFWQAEATAHLGSGLGLAIAKDIVEAHGGRIWAESNVGEGCTITITLPMATIPEDNRSDLAPENDVPALGGSRPDV